MEPGERSVHSVDHTDDYDYEVPCGRPASTPNADDIKALVAVVKSLPEEGNEAVFHLLKGQIFLLSNNRYLACEHLEKSLNVYREGDCEISHHVYSLLLQAYHDSTILYRAISVAREWVERYPKVATAHAALCHLLLEDGKLLDCLEACTHAITTLDESETIMSIYNTRGKCHAKRANYQQSVRDFQQVKTLAAKEGLVRFSEIKPAFLSATRPGVTAYPTAFSERSAEKKNIYKVLLRVAKEAGALWAGGNGDDHGGKSPNIGGEINVDGMDAGNGETDAGVGAADVVEIMGVSTEWRDGWANASVAISDEDDNEINLNVHVDIDVQGSPRQRNKAVHFGRSRSSSRLLTGNLGHVM